MSRQKWIDLVRPSGRCGLAARFAVVLMFALAPGGPAWSKPLPESDWDFVIAPFIWLPAMTGSAAVEGRTVDIDTSVSDLFTESDFIFAVQIEMAAWYKKRFGLLFNGQWTTLEQNDNSLMPANGPPFNPPGGGPGGPGLFPIEFNLQSNMGIFEFVGAYRVGTWELGGGASSPAFTLEPLVGARVTYLRSEFKPDGDLENLEQSKTWADPILGARMNLGFGKDRHWNAKFRGDFGGFGAGSDFTWNLMGMIGYEWRFETWKLEGLIGARALYQDYDDGSGLKRFEWDVTQYGPLLALVFKF